MGGRGPTEVGPSSWSGVLGDVASALRVNGSTSVPSWLPPLPPFWLFADRRRLRRFHRLMLMALVVASSMGRTSRSAQYPCGYHTYSYPSLGGRGGSRPNAAMLGNPLVVCRDTGPSAKYGPSR